jgi:hypothetical protein
VGPDGVRTTATTGYLVEARPVPAARIAVGHQPDTDHELLCVDRAVVLDHTCITWPGPLRPSAAVPALGVGAVERRL